MLDANMYFGHAVAGEEDDPLFTCLQPGFVHTVSLDASQRAYRITAEGNPVDGVAYFNADENVAFYDVQISLPKSQHALASAVLNQFVMHKKSK